MTIWKPASVIRVKVLGLVWRGDELLLGEVEDSLGRVTGVRPLGGAIEFGEIREQALHREFEEELGCAIALHGPWHCFENIFEHEGAIGHEFLFATNVVLADDRLYAQERISYLEDEGTSCRAGWFGPAALPAGVALYPSGLRALIGSGIVARPG